MDASARKLISAQTAEALARRRESEAMIMRGRKPLHGGKRSEALTEAATRFFQTAAELGGVAKELNKPGARDMAGTAPSLSDSKGAFAPDAAIAASGNVGVTDSNSRGAAEPNSQGDRMLEPTDEEKTALAASNVSGPMVGMTAEQEAALGDGAPSQGAGEEAIEQVRSAVGSEATQEAPTGNRRRKA